MASGEVNSTYIGDVPYGYGWSPYWHGYYPAAPAKQGWQCPVCGKVYSPDIPSCWQQHGVGSQWFEVSTVSTTVPVDTTQVNDTA